MSIEAEDFTPSNYITSVLLSWLVPGAGHWIIGQRGRAIVLSVSILGLFWFGQQLGEFRAVNRNIHPVFFVAQVGNGFSALLSNYNWAKPKGARASNSGVSRDVPPHLSTGIIFTSVSGLLNLLLVLQIADLRTWRPRTEKDSTSPAKT